MFKKLFQKKISEPLAFFDLDSLISLSSAGFPEAKGNEIEIEVGNDYVTYTETTKDTFESIDISFSQIEEAKIDKQENVFVLLLNTYKESERFWGLGKEIKVSLEGITEIDCLEDVDKIRDFINEQTGASQDGNQQQVNSNMMNVTCAGCGAVLIPNKKFCNYCGRPVPRLRR